MKAEEFYAIAELGYKAVQGASPKPLDAVLILADGEDIAASSQLLHSAVTNEGDHLRRQLQLYCAAIALIVERAEDPEMLLAEITHVIRREAFGEQKS